MIIEILWVDPEVPIQKEEKLFLHEVHLSDGKSKVLISSDGGVPGPVLVLGRGVVEVLCGEDERGKEDAMNSALHPLCNRW